MKTNIVIEFMYLRFGEFVAFTAKRTPNINASIYIYILQLFHLSYHFV